MEIFKLMATIAINSNEAIQELRQVEQQAEQTSSSLGQKLGNLGSLLKTGLVAGAAAAGAALAGVGAAAFKIGESFDEAYDTIRVGTGATGEALEGLKEDFRAVAARVPVDFAQVATAIADLNTRMGVSGPLAQSLAEQFLNLSRVTGQDVGTLIAQGSQAFNSWGISAEDAGGKLDYLFRVSQATGIGVDQLMAQVTQFGPVLREVGFDFETSAAMLGAFEREGINSTAVLTGFRNVVTQAAKDGKSAQQAIQELFDAIKNAKDPTEATRLAVEAFGSRAGPQLAQAIRSGRLDLEQFTASLKAGGDTINGVAAETDDFAQKWQLFKNQLMLAAEPLANTVFSLAGTLLDVLGPAIASLIQGAMPALQSFFGWIDATLSGAVMPALGRFAGWFSGTVLSAIQGFATQAVGAIATFVTYFREGFEDYADAGIFGILGYHAGRLAETLQQDVLPVLQQLVGWFTSTALPAIQNFAAQAMPLVQSALGQLGPFLTGTVLPALQSLASWFTTTALPAIQGFVESAWGPLQSALAQVPGIIAAIIAGLSPMLGSLQSIWQTISTQLWPALQQLFSALQSVWQTVQAQLWPAIQALMPVLQALGAVLGGVVVAAVGLAIGAFNGLVGFLAGALPGAIQAATGIIQAFAGVVNLIVTVVSGVVRIVVALLQGDWQAAWEAARDLVSGVAHAIGQIISGLVQTVTGLISGLVGGVLGLIQGFVDGVVSFFRTLYYELVGGSIVPDLINGMVNLFSGLPGRVLEYVGQLVSDVLAKASELKDSVISFFSDTVTWLVSAGRDIVQGLIDGLSSMLGQVWQKAEEIASTVTGALSKALDIFSPSRVMFRLGVATGEGFTLGLRDSFSAIVPEIESPIKAVVESAEHSPLASVAREVIAQNRALAPSSTEPAVNVRIWVGDLELRQIVRQEIEAAFSTAMRMVR